MQTYSKLKYAHISPQKCRLIADTVRGKRVGLALSTICKMTSTAFSMLGMGTNSKRP